MWGVLGLGLLEGESEREVKSGRREVAVVVILGSRYMMTTVSRCHSLPVVPIAEVLSN